MPQKSVLVSDREVAADQARDAGEVLGGDRVLLVWHGGGALLAWSKSLVELAHIRAMKMADLDFEALKRTGKESED